MTPARWTTDYVVVDKVEAAGGVASTRASFVVEAGSPTVHAG